MQGNEENTICSIIISCQGQSDGIVLNDWSERETERARDGEEEEKKKWTISRYKRENERKREEDECRMSRHE